MTAQNGPATGNLNNTVNQVEIWADKPQISAGGQVTVKRNRFTFEGKGYTIIGQAPARDGAHWLVVGRIEETFESRSFNLTEAFDTENNRIPDTWKVLAISDLRVGSHLQ